jgi:hypothetical protein
MSTLSIRLPNSIHQHAKRLAQTEGVSVNQLVSSALAEKLSALDAERYLNERAARGREVDIPRPPKDTRWGGRAKDTPNKVNQSIREAIQMAFEQAGGVEYLVRLAQ